MITLPAYERKLQSFKFTRYINLKNSDINCITTEFAIIKHNLWDVKIYLYYYQTFFQNKNIWHSTN
jgi:hypothetical protein